MPKDYPVKTLSRKELNQFILNKFSCQKMVKIYITNYIHKNLAIAMTCMKYISVLFHQVLLTN